MQFAKVQLKAGINRDQTRYAATGGWFSCDKVRFWGSLPEKIGGWTPYSRTPFLGTARSLTAWTSLLSDFFIAFGTHLKYYAFKGGNLNDITPIRRTVTLAAGQLASTSGQTVVQVTDASHGAIAGDFVTISGAVGFNGLLASELNKEQQITGIVNANAYLFSVTTPATATGAGGGTPTLVYQINSGLETTFLGTGWGAGPWGRGTWGSAADATVAGTLLRLWSQDQYGEDLVFCARGGPIYYYDVTFPTARAVRLDSMPGASDVPTSARHVLVTERIVIAYSTTPLGGGQEDPMLIRWSDKESAVNWTPTEQNSAGDFRLTVGSRIMTAIYGRQGNLVLTDEALYTQRYIGGQFVYSFERVASGITICGPNAAIMVNDLLFWMGNGNFYVYDGRVNVLPCTVNDFVFNRLNMAQMFKVYAGSNSGFGEVTWHFPSNDGQENDSYVTYSYLDKQWTYGSMIRTAWLDAGAYHYPLATDIANHWIYAHEFGEDDGSFNPPVGIKAFIRSSPFEIQDGYQMSFITRLIPDVTFRGIGEHNPINPSVRMTLIPAGYPGSNDGTGVGTTVTRGAVAVDVEPFTEQKSIRLRGRALIFEISSDGAGMGWRMGTPRLEIRTDGRR
jgi:hypothetical protein